MDLSSPVVRSEDIYRTYWLYWRLLGVERKHAIRYILDILITIFFTFWYPIHLIAGLFYETKLGDVCKGLPITAACLFASFKFVCFRCHSTMHLSQFGQFIASGISISITLVNILFFAENNFAMAYYGVYFVAMLVELFPSCYYGTLISVELNRLTDAIFSSNWVGMDRGYCRTLLIFMQLTLAKVELKAGGMIGISLNAFFATIRLAYSFFTLAMSLRK
ncbi:LOW QUALITY PROTEIN: odorant receptor 33b-like [Drosophila obscura]|uniref:LOW QUALITY PROTEIN: odorant receptor 33b-like n=1 Tax=Drosophila obscura TaxID=7282 RepID=UPI001BB28020|nr:LOW QUALITY PROTEIN: odorant receptor 33b-like [Drosophila obscura]